MKKGPQRDWAERMAERLFAENYGGISINEIARALRRAEKRGYQRGCKAEETYEQKNLPSGIQMGGAG